MAIVMQYDEATIQYSYTGTWCYTHYTVHIMIIAIYMHLYIVVRWPAVCIGRVLWFTTVISEHVSMFVLSISMKTQYCECIVSYLASYVVEY